MNYNVQLDAIAIEQEARQGQTVLNDIFTFAGRFVAYPSEYHRVAHTLWIGHTHLMANWESTPRIAFLSPEPASGKSRALEITEALVPRPLEAVGMSASSLFRSIEAEEDLPTILFDEVDTIFGPRTKDNNEDLRGLLNAGHHRGAKVFRSVLKGKQVEAKGIEVFCAAALAGLGWLPDTLLSRSIIIRMRRRHEGEQVEPYRRRIHRPQGHRIRDRFALWARSLPELAWPELPPQIQDRAADCWESLIAVADAAGGDWPKRARDAAVALLAERADAEPSLGIRLLTDLRTVFGIADEMASKSILFALHALPEAPWSDIKGKPLDERGLAYRLRQYSVRSKTIRLDAETTAKGYTRADLHDAWRRYAPAPAHHSVTSVTNVTPVTAVTDVTHKPLSARTEPDPDGWSFNMEDDPLDIPPFLRRN